MSSPTSVDSHRIPANMPSQPLSGRSRLRKTIVATVVAILVLIAAVVFIRKVWPYSRKSVLSDLAEASDSAVTVRSFHSTYFPPGAVLEGVEFLHGARRFKLITIENLRIRGSYLGILTSHVPRITAAGARIFIPAFGSNITFHSQHSKTVVDEIVANGAIVEFESDDPKKQALRFDVHEALLTGVRWGSPIHYDLKIHNPDPPGEISVRGQFGAWADGHPEDTPFSGEYKMDQADLSVYEGIGGTLTSRGRFGGVFKHLNISGETDTSNFEVKSSGHKVRLTTEFEAFVDAMNGDTFLNRVKAHFAHTTVTASGSIAGSRQGKGKTALLRLTSPNARVEDVLGLFVTEPRAPMSGPVSLAANVEIPPAPDPFLRKVTLQGGFGIDAGHFSKPETQKDVDTLSAGARGQSKEDPETVLTDLEGEVHLANGVAHFSDLRFEVPGAKARMQGTYNIVNYRIDLHGRMRVDTRISHTTSGVKALLLKVMDPFFKKKKRGEVVPVHIEGTYEKPRFGLDITQPDDVQSRK